jgi:uncharacterized protein
MLDSPFIFGKTVSEDAFTNREAEMLRLKNNMFSGINTMIISPRRWGKSSLVERVSNDILQQNSKIAVVNIDLFSSNTFQDFLEVFAKSVIKASSNRAEDWINAGKDFFKNVIPRLSFGASPQSDFSLSFDFNNHDFDSDEILNLAEEIAVRKKIKFIINIDEFQNIAGYKDYEDADKKLRSIWQKQKNVTYCLYGSRRHLMEEIFTDSSKPFYKFGDILFLQKIKREKWVDFITSKFVETKKVITEEFAGQIADLMQNHPWYVQQICYFIWHKTHKSVTEEIIADSLNEVINSNLPLFKREIEILSRTQINLLKAVAGEETQFSSVDVMRRYQLGTPANAMKNIKILLKNDLLIDNYGKLIFSDPVFLYWFKRDYLN